MTDPAYSEKSIRELVETIIQAADAAGEVETSEVVTELSRLLASAIDELRGMVEHQDERIRQLEERITAA